MLCECGGVFLVEEIEDDSTKELENKRLCNVMCPECGKKLFGQSYDDLANKFNLITDKTKEELERLNRFIQLVDNYEAKTFEQSVIKEYAIHNSIRKVIECFAARGIEIKHQDVVAIIKSKPLDELHKIVKAGHSYKTRKNRQRARLW